jgi:hypothetical protein
MTPFLFPMPFLVPSLERRQGDREHFLNFLQVLAGQVKGLHFLEVKLSPALSGFVASRHE